MDTIKNGTQEIETNRLILRRFTACDADMMFKNWASDPAVAKYLTWDTHENVEFTKGLLKEWVEGYKNNESYNWVIVLKENNMPVGSIGTVPRPTPEYCAEVGYCIGKAWWGQGIVSEALSAVISYLFKEGFYRIQARHNILNVNSGKVMEKCGMKFEGIVRAGTYMHGEYTDTPMYSILKSD